VQFGILVIGCVRRTFISRRQLGHGTLPIGAAAGAAVETTHTSVWRGASPLGTAASVPP
jgi:hypothetical protein